MKLHEISTEKRRRRRRIGRGGKRGTFSWRGTKGQKSRAGRRMRPAERDLIIRIPKRRGFQNKPKSAKSLVLNLRDIAAALRTYGGNTPVTVDRAFLERAHLVPKSYRGKIKILGTGEFHASVEFKGMLISGSAREKIVKSGGQVLA